MSEPIERVEWGILIPGDPKILQDPLRFSEAEVRRIVATDNSLGGPCRVVRRVVTETEWEEPS